MAITALITGRFRVSSDRPAARVVVSIGRFFVALGLFICVVGAACFLAAVFGAVRALPETSLIYRTAAWLTLLVLCFGVFVVVAATSLFKFRAWAKRALEVVSWIGIFYLPALLVARFVSGDLLAALALCIVGCVVAVVFIAILRALKSEEIRQLFHAQ